jgi:adenosylcobinamide-GDP ribazoletransferase
LLLLPARQAVASLTLGLICAACPGLVARRLLGGYTGDILGAIEQAFEVGAFLGVAALGLP